jgi:hypothetical protein
MHQTIESRFLSSYHLIHPIRLSERIIMMERKKYVYWKDDNLWLGYLLEYPDYMTQGKTLKELKDNLRDIYNELSSGHIPCVRKVDELEVA